MLTDHSNIDFVDVAQVVEFAGLFVPVILDPTVVALDFGAVLLAEEDVLQSGSRLDASASVVHAHPNLAQVFFEDGHAGVGQSFGDKEGVCLLHHTRRQNGIQKGVVLRLFSRSDDFGHFAIFRVIVEKGKQLADCWPSEGVSRNTCE